MELPVGVFVPPSDTVVIPTNTLGVMGAGLALDAAKRIPGLELAYKRACRQGEIAPGILFVYRQTGGQTIICLPTKRHFRDMSHLEDVEAGIRKLASCPDLGRIAVPKLGCGLGGLSWSQVRPLLYQHLGDRRDHTLICIGATRPPVDRYDPLPSSSSIW